MAYTLSPSTLTATSEGTQINQTITVVKGGMDPAVTSIVVYKLEHTQGNINVNIASSSFTVNGQYKQNWNQTIYYEEFRANGNANVTVNQFSNISSNLNFVSGFIANTSPSTLTANYAVSINSGANIFITQVIKKNYTPDKDSLIAAVARGKF